MILTRFWAFLLTVAAVIGVAAALVTASLVDDQYRTAAVNDLVRDRFEVEQTLKLDARARLDAIAPIAANGDVRTALRRAGARRNPMEVEEELSTSLRQTLQRLNGQLEQMAGDLVFAVDADGWVIAAVAPVAPPEGAGLGQFPLVRRALEGYLSDDVWVYNDGVYRMAARPVVEGGQYVGALIHGKRYDDQLAELLSQRLGGASVAFFQGEATFASYMPAGAPRRDDLGNPLAGTVLADERFVSGDRTDAIELDAGGFAVYSLVTGSARHAQVGYAIGRPVRTLGDPWNVFDQVGSDKWAALPWIPLGGGGFVVFLFAMIWIWLERDRPLSKLKKAAGALKDAPENRFTITDFGGRYRAVASAVNDALDATAVAAGAGAPGKAVANLDEILGPADKAGSGPAFFGFAGGDQGPVDLPDVPPAGPAGGLPPLGAPAGGLPPAPPAGAAPPPPKPQAPRPPPPKPPPPRPTAQTPEPPASDPDPVPAAPASKAQPIEAPPQSSRKKLKSTLLGVAPPDDDDDDEDEESTMVARVPEELLAASAGSSDEETAHFREVFQQFKAMKEQCGEPTASLTFEKFRVTLEKNRDQIVKRHGARRVRFTVYAKNGKAALKATPIKD
ncbi:MAG: MXAN_5187 family protein [Sandaracinaceae bacterium]